MYYSSLLGQCRSTQQTPRQLRRHSVRWSRSTDTQPSLPTDRKGQVCFQLGLSGLDYTQRHSAVCQWKRSKGRRGRAVQPQNQHQNINIFVALPHLPLGICHPGYNGPFQLLAPPLHRHGTGRCLKYWQNPPLMAMSTPTLKFLLLR